MAKLMSSKDGLRTLQRILGLRKGVSGRKDGGDSSGTALVAIDFEYTGSLLTKFRACKNSQTGLAILLDPRGGTHHPGSGSSSNGGEKDPIRTHNFITGSAKYFNKSSRRYIFGESVPVKPDALLRKIMEKIPTDREVVLLAHGAGNERKVLRALGYEFPASVAGMLDTREMAGCVFGGSWRPSLVDLLRGLGCAAEGLHSAGNDAYFTLRAALLLAARESAGQV